MPFVGGRPAGGYSVFVAGFWVDGEGTAEVIGRAADVAVARDGSLLIADDVSQSIWRVAYSGEPATRDH